MRGENPQLTNLPRRGYNMFQSNDGEGRRPAPSESRRAVEAGGKGLQVLWLLSRGFEGLSEDCRVRAEGLLDPKRGVGP